MHAAESAPPILNVAQQSAILSAIEDLETVTRRVYAQCEECFRSTLVHYHRYERGADSEDASASQSFALPPSPRALLKKSVSNLTASSSFSLIGSEMLDPQGRSGGGSGSGGGLESSSAFASGVLVLRPGETNLAGIKRGWDWRAGLPEDAKAEDVLRILRLGLAKGMSFAALG